MVRTGLHQNTDLGPNTLAVDYEGIGINSRTANSKAAASECSSIFQNHYPEFLVRDNTSLADSALI